LGIGPHLLPLGYAAHKQKNKMIDIETLTQTLDSSIDEGLEDPLYDFTPLSSEEFENADEDILELDREMEAILGDADSDLPQGDEEIFYYLEHKEDNEPLSLEESILLPPPRETEMRECLVEWIASVDGSDPQDKTLNLEAAKEKLDECMRRTERSQSLIMKHMPHFGLSKLRLRQEFHKMYDAKAAARWRTFKYCPRSRFRNDFLTRVSSRAVSLRQHDFEHSGILRKTNIGSFEQKQKLLSERNAVSIADLKGRFGLV
jgi:hypothetical protein